jgi:tetratricopeptide (TPR) repeat protein
LDKRPEALRPLLQAYVQTEKFEQADPIAAKLLEAHNDLSAVSLYADALFTANKPEQAMSVYERNAEKLLGNKQTFIEWLTASEAKARESAPAMQTLLTLMQRAGATGAALREVQEQLAHALVQNGDLQKAADLYRELSEAEPENPQHNQNYRQIIARMGKDSVTRELSVEEGGQALMVDELEAAPAVVQEYPREITEAINAALTDSELFSSYNVPEKAIFPLERLLPKASNDVRVRQRLASLYARLERFADAADCCAVLADVHAAAGLGDQALQYREMATKYSEQAARRAPAPKAAAAPPAAEAPAMEAPAVAEFSIETPADSQSSVAEFDLTSVSAEDLAQAPPTEAPAPAAAETEHVNEWEDMLTVEEPVSETAAEAESTTQFIGERQMEEISAEETPEEILEEARFYLSQDMRTEAQSAISRLARVAPNHPELSTLRSSAGMGEAGAAVPELETVSSDAPTSIKESAAEPEGQVVEFDLQSAESAIEAPNVPALELDIAAVTPAAAPAEEISIEAQPVPAIPADEVLPVAEPAPTAQAPAQARADAEEVGDADILGDLAGEQAEEVALDDLMPEIATGEPASFTAPPVGIPPSVPVVPRAVAAPTMSAAAQSSAAENPLADMVSDLEDALGDLAPPTPKKPAEHVPQPMAAASPPKSVPAPIAAAAPAAQLDQVEAHSMLSGLLDEFKEGIDEPAEEADDPDTHYNLGVAFREMGLLDEAIGELQKVCRAVDSGKPFSQPIQAYTWLAQCLVDKGAAQAAIRWYERALQVKGISEDSRLAVCYDMANAFESAGNKKAALDNFMEVYGANIDYRDVADRIRSLRK